MLHRYVGGPWIVSSRSNPTVHLPPNSNVQTADQTFFLPALYTNWGADSPTYTPPPLLLWRRFVCKHFLFSQAAQFGNSQRKFPYNDEAVNPMPKPLTWRTILPHFTWRVAETRWSYRPLGCSPIHLQFTDTNRTSFPANICPEQGVGTLDGFQQGYSNFKRGLEL